jgi:hypothetical protein
MAEQDIGIAVIVEVPGSFDLPAGRRERDVVVQKISRGGTPPRDSNRNSLQPLEGIFFGSSSAMPHSDHERS